ncbi:hypothetical protein L1856_02130 [Streptomyces sp. Tue 6430]|nr:hypothetical protein [Streptomyces sp. Tue 6430]
MAFSPPCRRAAVPPCRRAVELGIRPVTAGLRVLVVVVLAQRIAVVGVLVITAGATVHAAHHEEHHQRAGDDDGEEGEAAQGMPSIRAPTKAMARAIAYRP